MSHIGIALHVDSISDTVVISTHVMIVLPIS